LGTSGFIIRCVETSASTARESVGNLKLWWALFRRVSKRFGYLIIDAHARTHISDSVTTHSKGLQMLDVLFFVLISRDVILNRFERKRKEDFGASGFQSLVFRHVPLHSIATSQYCKVAMSHNMAIRIPLIFS